MAALVIARFLRRSQTGTARPVRSDAAAVSVLVPVLDEERRLDPCLQGLCRLAPEVSEILLLDGGSQDGTVALAEQCAAGEPKLRVVRVGAPPPGWNGKAWNLEAGRRLVTGTHLLTVDADVRLGPGALRLLLGQAQRSGLASTSLATRQEVPGLWLGALHPALLTTYIYRQGRPGRISGTPQRAEASGQCQLLESGALSEIGGFGRVRASTCEDVSLARELTAAGYAVGLFEGGGAATTRMYETVGEAWRGMPRSLALRDRFWSWRDWPRLAGALLTQALPLPLSLLTSRRPGALRSVNLALLVLRLGVLLGTRRAYASISWTYWLSPLADIPAALALTASAVRRKHTWRGRTLVSDGSFRSA